MTESVPDKGLTQFLRSAKTLGSGSKKNYPFKLRFIALLAIGAAIITLVYASLKPFPVQTSPSIIINNLVVPVEVVSTAEEQRQGLSGRPDLPVNKGMLFVFDSVGSHCIWMRDMKFSLDIFWINESGAIVRIKENVSPGTYPESFCADNNAKFVLETKSGFADRHNIRPGQLVELANTNKQ